MNTAALTSTLSTLFAELTHGAGESAYILNRGDAGLLASLDTIAAEAASAPTPTGSSIAAHVDHVRFGLSLMNRWGAGEPDPFAAAEWSASWRRTSVSDGEWRRLRADLRREAERWLEGLRTPRDVSEIELNGMIGSIAHLAYHLGAIRQINQALRGPRETG